MQAKLYFAIAFSLLLGALFLGWAVLQRRSASESEAAEYRMRKFAGKVERLARKRQPKDAEALRNLIASELRRTQGAIILAGLRDDTQPFRRVHVQNGVALIGSYPIEFHGQRITLRLATLIEATVPYRAQRRLAA
jgi:hypothetical protein